MQGVPRGLSTVVFVTFSSALFVLSCTDDAGQDGSSEGPATADEADDGEESESEGDGDGDGDGTNDATGDEDGGVPQDCDPWLQDCPEGEKCVVALVDDWFNKCVPVLGDGQAGEPCTYAGLAEATDDCGPDSYCWNSAWVENLGGSVGLCTPFCQGTPDEPSCPAGRTCVMDDPPEGPPMINMCVEGCNPIAQDCADEPHDEIGCYTAGEAFFCAASTLDIPIGEPCDYINDCVPGSMCVPGESLPSCAGEGCCTTFCDLTIRVGEQCGELPGTHCEPLYEQGMAPFGFESVGVCQL